MIDVRKKRKQVLKAKLSPVAYALALMVAAFVAALLFRRSAGVLAMFPIGIIICGAAAFLPVDEKTKTVVFGVTAFVLNTVETKDMRATAIFTAILTLGCFAFSMGVKYILKKKKAGYALFIGTAVVCVALSLAFVGNPIAAIGAQQDIDAYTNEKYHAEDNAALGSFEFSSIYYNFADGTYSVEAVSDKFPAEGGIISAKNGQVTDLFEPVMMDKITEPYEIELIKILRASFPNDKITVSCDGIALLPNEELFGFAEGELYGDLTFEIILSGVQTATGMTEQVSLYMDAIDFSGFDYNKIIFKGGISPWVTRSVTVDKNYKEGNIYLITHAMAGTSNLFDRYINRLLKIPA